MVYLSSLSFPFFTCKTAMMVTGPCGSDKGINDSPMRPALTQSSYSVAVHCFRDVTCPCGSSMGWVQGMKYEQMSLMRKVLSGFGGPSVRITWSPHKAILQSADHVSCLLCLDDGLCILSLPEQTLSVPCVDMEATSQGVKLEENTPRAGRWTLGPDLSLKL